jgi:hypothetical protein
MMGDGGGLMIDGGVKELTGRGKTQRGKDSTERGEKTKTKKKKKKKFTLIYLLERMKPKSKNNDFVPKTSRFKLPYTSI